MEMHKIKQLDREVNDEHNKEKEVSCYKLQIAYLINEIIVRHTVFNKEKLQAVSNIESDVIQACKINAGGAFTGSDTESVTNAI